MTDLELRPRGDAPEPPAEPAAASASRRWLWVALGAWVLILSVGAWLVATRLPRWLTAAPGTGTTSTDTSASEARRIQATLFYVSEDGTALVGVNRDVLYGATPAEQARLIVEAQVGTPPNERLSAIPKGTTVRSVYLTETHEAYVDLGGPIVSGQAGGSLNEALSVYAIVNAIITNLPDITGVQILVDGKEVDSLAGHLDLRAPLGKATDWIQKGQ
jgi:hypothetical protein